MEENKLVPRDCDSVEFDEEIYGVRVESRKRRRKRKHHFKRFLIFAVAFGLILITVYNFENISVLFSSLFNAETEGAISSSNQSSTLDNPDTQSDENEGNADDTNQYDFTFVDTSPAKFNIFFENALETDINGFAFDLPSCNDIYSTYGKDSPVVLLISLSPQEGFSNGEGYSYNSSFYNEEKNVSKLCEQICANLCELGVNAIYLSKEIGDVSLTQYQAEYVKEIEKTLESNPSIAYVFDISRAFYINDNMTANREQTEINGIDVPTLGFICGTSQSVITESQGRSIYFANQLADSANANAPLLVSSLTVSQLELNLKFDRPCIRIDIGSYANTFEEASLAADFLTLALINFLQ